jgi:hypothetical protein
MTVFLRLQGPHLEDIFKLQFRWKQNLNFRCKAKEGENTCDSELVEALKRNRPMPGLQG